MPEPYGENRNLIPEETFVLLGSYKNEDHLKWILNNKIYNARTGTRNGSLRLKQEITAAKYVLLHGVDKQLLLRLSDKGPRIMSKDDLEKKPFGNLYSPSALYYVVFDLSASEVEDEFKNVKWDIKQMISDGILGKGHSSAEPRGVSMVELMKYVIKSK